MIVCNVRGCLFNDHGECDETDNTEFGRPLSEGIIEVASQAECVHGRYNNVL